MKPGPQKEIRTLHDHKFITPNDAPERRCNLTMKLQRLVKTGVIKQGQLTDVVAEHDDDNCGLFHELDICTCDPEIYNLKGERFA